MANTIILKRSATPGKVPTTGQLALGEIAINTHDGLIYIKKDDGVSPSVVQIGGVTSVNGETGAVTIDTGDVAENGNQYFTNARARAAVSAGSGISYNSSTGVISTTQTLTTAGTPTFAGLTLTGGISSIAGDIIPSADITYDLGSPTRQWKDIYVGPGSLYVNGTKVLEDNSGTITFTADADQNIRINTVGAGVLQLGSSTTNVNVDGTLQIASGKNITDSAGVEVNFGDNIDMNNNKVVGLGAPSANTDAATKKYVDDTVGALSTSSITQGNSNVQVVDTGTGTVTVTVDGSTALTVTSAGVVVAGNFTVQGTTTTIEANTINLADNIITLNSDATGAPSQNAGVEVERGDEANTQLRWNEGSDKWTFTNDGAVYHPIAVNTDDLTEGSTNQYHTTARARGTISASSSSGVSYNSSTGVISLGAIPNSSLSNNSITINGASVALGGTRTLDTADISEGSNLYFTDARARGAVGASGSLSYNSTTGVFSYTTPSTSGITEGTNLYYTDSRARNAIGASGDLSYSSATGVVSFTQNKAWSALTGTPTTLSGYGIANAYTKTEVDSAITSAVAGKDNTDEITEGTTNLYFTNARARGAVSAGTGISYNSSTGVITNTSTDTTNASNITSGTLPNARLVSVPDSALATISTAGKVSNSATTATSSSVANAIVTRNGSGDFSANTITVERVNADDVIFPGSFSGAITLKATGVAGTGTVITLPGRTGTVITSADTGTITSTMIADNAIVNADINAAAAIAYSKLALTGSILNADLAGSIANAKLANSAITVTAGTGLSGGGSVSLGGSVTLTNTITQYTDALARGAVSAGTGISYNSTTGVITNTITQYTDALAVSANTSAIATAKSEAISTAAADATSKANAAQAAAIAAVTNGAGAAFDTLKEIQDAMATDTELASAIAAISNVPSATKLQTARTINGASFDGTANVSFSTSAVSEGTNLYYTDGRARAAHSFTAGSGAYNSSTGVITIPTNTNQLTNGAGYVTSSGVTSVATGNGLTGGTITSTGTLALSGSYTGTWAVSGAITATGEVTAFFSDQRLKTNIVPIAEALDKVESISGYTFDPNETALALGVEDRHQMGVIAQEIELVAPELVCDSAFAGYKTVRYDKLTALLIEAVKELSAKVKTLEAQLGNAKPQL